MSAGRVHGPASAAARAGRHQKIAILAAIILLVFVLPARLPAGYTIANLVPQGPSTHTELKDIAKLSAKSSSDSRQEAAEGWSQRAHQAPKRQSLDYSILRYHDDNGRGVNFQMIHGQEVTWEKPLGKPKGVVIFGHGCYHAGSDMWLPHPRCSKCIGLPEEVMWRRAALARNLVVIGISSKDRKGRGCWFELKRDNGTSAARVARTLIKRLDLQELPLFSMGASSGGLMAMSLPQVMPEISGVYAQVRGLALEKLVLPDGRKYPPIAFVHMAKMDPENAQLIGEDIALLDTLGVPCAQAYVDPRPVTVEHLTSHSVGMVDPIMAKKIIQILRENELMNDDNMLTYNPRSIHDKWTALVRSVTGNLSLTIDRSNLAEVLNVAYARHEFSHEMVDPVLQWLENGGRGGQEALDKLVEADRKIEDAVSKEWERHIRDLGYT